VGDLIYREDAIVALTQSADYIGDALDRLCKVPAVDADPVVHGRWIIDSDGLPVCSVCDEIAMQKMFCDTLHKTWRYDVRLVKTPYCPNCGAKMDGERRADNGMDA